MSLGRREASDKAEFTKEPCSAIKIPSLRVPRQALRSFGYQHVRMQWQPRRKPNPRNALRFCRKPARGLLHKVAREGIRSIAAQVQATDHGTMALGRRAIRSSLIECIQQLHLLLVEQIDQSTHVTQEQVLGRIAQRFPKYKSVISAIPAVAKCIPEELKQRLAVRSQSKSFKIALVLLNTWVK
jgi:hypothetical protein